MKKSRTLTFPPPFIIFELSDFIDNRIPASILTSSPWFSSYGIKDASDASNLLRQHIEKTLPKQNPNLLSFSAIAAMKESQMGLGIYK